MSWCLQCNFIISTLLALSHCISYGCVPKLMRSKGISRLRWYLSCVPRCQTPCAWSLRILQGKNQCFWSRAASKLRKWRFMLMLLLVSFQDVTSPQQHVSACQMLMCKHTHWFQPKRLAPSTHPSRLLHQALKGTQKQQKEQLPLPGVDSRHLPMSVIINTVGIYATAENGSYSINQFYRGFERTT